MNGKLTGNTIISSKKFDTITIVENGLILTNKQKEKTTILFSVINKTYIKKHKISFLNKICFLTIFLILSQNSLGILFEK